MGRYRWDKKQTVEECKSISTTFLKKHDYFCGSRWGGMRWTNGQGEETGSICFSVRVNEWDGEIRFQYTQTNRSTDEKESLDYRVRLVATPCNYGNKRWWFICPLARNAIICTRRVGKLYLGSGKHFGCRLCYKLTYTSAQKHDKRVDALMRNPELLLRAVQNRSYSRMDLIALKALFKLKRKERKKGR